MFESLCTVPSSPGAPEPVLAPTAVTLSWDAPEDGGKPISAYAVQ
jgi:hypothetical protein